MQTRKTKLKLTKDLDVTIVCSKGAYVHVQHNAHRQTLLRRLKDAVRRFVFTGLDADVRHAVRNSTGRHGAGALRHVLKRLGLNK